jgi:hypothetical protein
MTGPSSPGSRPRTDRRDAGPGWPLLKNKGQKLLKEQKEGRTPIWVYPTSIGGVSRMFK